MIKYIIVKNTRCSNEMYEGITWEHAGIKHLYKPFYTDKKLALEIADKLSKFNIVGFTVDELKES